jgi:hypothetical protein
MIFTVRNIIASNFRLVRILSFKKYNKRILMKKLHSSNLIIIAFISD